MNPEFGHFAAVAALVMAAASSLAFYGAATRRPAWVAVSRSLVTGHCVLLLFAFVVLVLAFLGDDFSVAYVARNSNSALPWYYKISAVWGAHEGSFLLWCLVMAAWMSAVAAFGKQLPSAMQGRVIGVLSLVQVGFLLFLLATSNPFERLAPGVPEDGGDLNPLLQDIGLIIHPPFLYMGYVGFSVAFAFAVAALLTGRLDAAWARWSRPWTNLAWAFQTMGILLGSWWAYYELGWGGWWFWDPVENASFLPWLAGTALVHSLAVTEKRGAFKSWTVLLALATFSLCLMGAFIVRSGVLTSVHAFAQDPTRGMYILWFLILVVGGSLTLYLLRAPSVRSRLQYGGLSRELLLLANNLLFVTAVAVVLIGTLYPLAYEVLTGGKVSVGPPYFNKQFVPVMLILAALLAIAPVVRWKHTPLRLLGRSFALLGVALVVGVAVPLVIAGELTLGAVVAIALGTWVIATHLHDIATRRVRSLGHVGMVVAHVGFAVCLLGVAVTSAFSAQKDARMMVGERVELAGRGFTLSKVETVAGPNYSAERATFTTDDGVLLHPERRFYPVRGEMMTEAGIHPGFTRDLYVTLGETLEGGSHRVRVQYKPLVRWIWLGGILMGLGGVIAMADRRYRRLAVRDAAAHAEAPPSGAVRA